MADWELFIDKAMLIMDSVGLGIFTSLGVMSGIDNGYPDNSFLLVFIGMLTGVGGGLMRDMMAGEEPYIFVKHIYACASLVGALGCVWIFREWGRLRRYLSELSLSWRSVSWQHITDGIFPIRNPRLNCCSF